MKQQITKLGACKSQLQQAIRLYFNGGDPVSIHTLIMASYDLLRGVNAYVGGAPMITEFAFLADDPDLQKRVRNAMREASNFFKHADKDPDGVIEFAPLTTEFFIEQVCEQYYKLTGDMFPELAIYRGWFMRVFKDVLIERNAPLTPEALRLVAEIESKYTLDQRAVYYYDYGGNV